MPSSRAGRLPVSSAPAWLGRKFLYSPFRHLVEWGRWDCSGTAVGWCVCACACVRTRPSHISISLHSSFRLSHSIVPFPPFLPLPLSWAQAGLELWQPSASVPQVLGLVMLWATVTCAFPQCPWMGPVSIPASIPVSSSTTRFSMLQSKHSMNMSRINV